MMTELEVPSPPLVVPHPHHPLGSPSDGPPPPPWGTAPPPYTHICRHRNCSIKRKNSAQDAFKGLPMYRDLLLDRLGVKFLGRAPLHLELLHILSTFHWNPLGSTLGWWFCLLGRRLGRRKQIFGTHFRSGMSLVKYNLFPKLCPMPHTPRALFTHTGQGGAEREHMAVRGAEQTHGRARWSCHHGHK